MSIGKNESRAEGARSSLCSYTLFPTTFLSIILLYVLIPLLFYCMANLVKWLPNGEADIASYRIERSTAATTGFTSLTTITHNLGDAGVYDGTHFFYNDTGGTNAHYYRLISIDTGANESAPSPSFIPAAAPPAPFAQTVGLNQDYGGTRNLTPVDGDGANIDLCQIRVYTKADYDADIFTTPVGITESNAAGNWVNTIFVSPAVTYTIHFEKANAFNPNTVEVTV